MKLSGSGDDVLAGLVDPGLDARVRLGQTLQAFDELRQVVCVLDLDGDLHDGRDGELHDLCVICQAKISNRSSDCCSPGMARTFMLWAVSEVVRVPDLSKN